MFYTKYRPQKFSDISKPSDVADAISNQVRNGKTAHAYLFVGPRGTGKTTTARILAKALNCDHVSKEGDPCNKCSNCLAITNGSFLDLIEIDAASNRGIDDIRELKEKIRLAPSFGKKKVYIIDETHMLTAEAFNALLKTLEEPPPHAVFILCTTELHKVPETIKSRCLLFKFKRASVLQLTEKMKMIADAEGAVISAEDLRQIAVSVHGGFRDAETLLQQVIEGEINTAVLLNVGALSNIYAFVDFLIKNDHKNALRVINSLYLDGVDLYVWTGELLKYLRQLMFILVGAEEGLVDVSEDLLKDMKSQVKSTKTHEVISFLSTFEEASKSIKSSFITQLPLEIAIVKLCNLDGGLDSEANIEEQQADNEVEVTQIKAEDEIDVNFLASNWQEVIRELSLVNNTTAALVKVCKVHKTVGSSVYLEVPFDFHKERIENSRNRTLIESAIGQIVGVNVHVSCIVKKRERLTKNGETGQLTDYNVVVSSKDELLDFFDGGLPL